MQDQGNWRVVREAVKRTKSKVVGMTLIEMSQINSMEDQNDSSREMTQVASSGFRNSQNVCGMACSDSAPASGFDASRRAEKSKRNQLFDAFCENLQ